MSVFETKQAPTSTLAVVPLRPQPQSPTDPIRQLLNYARALVVDGVAASSRRVYAAALDEFITWAIEGNRPLTKASVQNYRAHLESRGLAPATINVRLSAVRRLAAEAADNGLLDPQVAAGVARAKGAKHSGRRTGNWLSQDHAERLLAAPDPDTLKGKRDTALFAVMIGCGLRREETACLTLEHIQQREGRWVIVDLVGKGARVRTVPMPSWAKAAIEEWSAAAGVNSGRVFRSVNRGGRVTGDCMTAQAIFKIVIEYTTALGFKSVAPHDLRRTFAKLAHKGNSPLEQIQLSLGHASIQTTERYLGVKQDLTDAPCDRLGLKPRDRSCERKPSI